MARKLATPSAQVRGGDRFPDLQLTSITDEIIGIPDPTGALTHLQFRRFAGCPICNLHLHSTAELRKYQDDMPFPVVGDPDKQLYRRFGVEASAKAILKAGAWRALPAGWRQAVATAVANRRAPLPADLLIGADGRVKATKYGSHAYDQWSVDELLSIAKDLNPAQ
jgi:hypothetical protein